MKRAVLFALAALLTAFLSACAGSKPDEQSGEADPNADYSEIEQYLGLTEEDRQDQSQSSGDDELLQLLSGDSEAADPPAAQQKPAADPAEVDRLVTEKRRLEDSLREKDQTISILRAQIMSMEEEQRTAAPAEQAPRQPMVVTAQPGMSDSEYEYQYQSGYELFQNRQYRDAMQVFESLLASRTDHKLSDNAQYWIGESYFALGDFRAAVLAFEKVFTFENSNKNEDAQYKLGLCYMRLDDRQRAREELQSFLDNDSYTNARLRTRAQDLLSQL